MNAFLPLFGCLLAGDRLDCCIVMVTMLHRRGLRVMVGRENMEMRSPLWASAALLLLPDAETFPYGGVFVPDSATDKGR